jgi:hypothetical protein
MMIFYASKKKPIRDDGTPHVLEFLFQGKWRRRWLSNLLGRGVQKYVVLRELRNS